jgi:hypothetical protein
MRLKLVYLSSTLGQLFERATEPVELTEISLLTTCTWYFRPTSLASTLDMLE